MSGDIVQRLRRWHAQLPVPDEDSIYQEAADEIERLSSIVDRIPPDRLDPWHTVTVKADGWHMAHPIDCVLADCAFDGLATEWDSPPNDTGVWRWHKCEDPPDGWERVTPSAGTENEPDGGAA